MKNLSIVINIVLFVAVAGLYGLVLNDSDSGDNKKANQAKNPVAYVHTDSLVKKFQYVADQNKRLEKRTSEIQQDLQNRASGLQREFQDYRQNLSNITIAQAQRIEKDLARKERELALFQENAQKEVAGLESEVTRELYAKLTDYLDRYCAQNSIQVVVKYDVLSDVLYAEKGLDITSEVIRGLNQEYKEGTPTKSASDSSAKK